MKVYVSRDKKPIKGELRGIKGIEQTTDGLIIEFHDNDSAYRAAQTLMNSGYETVRILRKG